MNKHDPITEKIINKQEEINEESQLVRKKNKINLFSVGTSLLLFTSVLITVIRTLLLVLK